MVQLVKDQLETSEEETQKEKTQEMKLCCMKAVNSKLRLLLFLNAQSAECVLPFIAVYLIIFVTAN